MMILALAIAATPPEVPAAPPPAEEKKICQTIVATGSRLGGKRVCHTKAEWRAQAAAADATMERARQTTQRGSRR